MMGLQRGESKYVITLISIREISPGAKQGQKASVVMWESLQIPHLRSSISRLGLKTGKCGFQRFASRFCAVLWDPCQARRTDHKEQKSDCDRALKHSSPESRPPARPNLCDAYFTLENRRRWAESPRSPSSRVIGKPKT